MKMPSWAVLYNIVSKNSEWTGKGWEFFNEEADAERCYNEQNDNGNCATKRPFHKKTDVPHMGACHSHLLDDTTPLANDSTAIEFAEWIILTDIVQLNSGVWAKNNPAFDQNYAKDTRELFEKFKCRDI